MFLKAGLEMKGKNPNNNKNNLRSNVLREIGRRNWSFCIKDGFEVLVRVC